MVDVTPTPTGSFKIAALIIFSRPICCDRDLARQDIFLVIRSIRL
jgi:hypothetical protein